MEKFPVMLQKSCSQYSCFFKEVVAAVELAQQNNFSEISRQMKKLNAMFADILQTDQELLAMSNTFLIQSNSDLWQKRSEQIERTLAFHRESLPRLHSIMAVQRADIQKIRSGIRGMSGYRNESEKTGQFIKSTR